MTSLLNDSTVKTAISVPSTVAGEIVGTASSPSVLTNKTTIVDDAKCDVSKKQGSYRKIKTHSESKISQLVRLDEVFAVAQILFTSQLKSKWGSDYIKERYNKDDLNFLRAIYKKVMPGWDFVLREILDTVLVDVAIFCLVLRALDTIEDDMIAFESKKDKIEHLQTFHEKLGDTTWTMDGVGLGDDRLLLQKFDSVNRLFNQLPKTSQIVIKDITKRMGYGMAEFVERDLSQGTETISESNKYCHYGGGLVGIGLSQLFAGPEPPETIASCDNLKLADQMGILLIRTDQIHDFYPDYVDNRVFWPKSVWTKYSVTGDIGYFVTAPYTTGDPTPRVKSLQCLNELVTDVLEFVPDCLQYISKLTVYEIFRCCVIPQIVALATLEKCYNNFDVFTGIVKIRKGLLCKLILQTNSLLEVLDMFNYFASKIKRRAIIERRNGFVDPNYNRTLAICDKICSLTSVHLTSRPSTLSIVLHWMSYPMIVSAFAWRYIPNQILATNAIGKMNINESIIRTWLLISGSILYKYCPGSIRSYGVSTLRKAGSVK